MRISKEQVDHVASLAKLSFSEEETQILMDEMSDVITMTDALKELNVEGVAPTTHAVNMQNVYRKDVMQPCPDREALLRNSRFSDGAAVVVPRVVE